ncbi:BTB domain containing protein [Pyrenophora teres f. maculata]|nr:BTB domain containing protein [Pyrenophora teres f. maculata]
MPPHNPYSQPMIYDFTGYDKAPFDVKIVVNHDGSTTELHAHKYILQRCSWFEKRLRRYALNTAPPLFFNQNISAMPEGKQVVTVENQDPLFLRLFVKYLYNNELEEQEVVSTVSGMAGMSEWSAQHQYNFRRLLGYVTLCGLGEVYDSSHFVHLLTERFITTMKQMEPSDLGWWIDWYHGYHTDQWNDGSRAMIAWAVLHNKAFLFHDAFLWLIARCPAMGTAILIEQAKQLEESESFACYFRDHKEKKAGWFTVHES